VRNRSFEKYHCYRRARESKSIVLHALNELIYLFLQKNSFAWSEGGEEGGGGGGGGGGGTGGTGTGTGPATTGGGGLAHWVSVMAEHIHNPHSATGVGVHHQQQSPPQPPYPWNNGLSSDVSTLFLLHPLDMLEITLESCNNFKFISFEIKFFLNCYQTQSIEKHFIII